MHAATVETLITKAKFQPEIAIAIAEAMDQASANAQLVTTSVLDERLAQLKAELVRWIFLVMLGNVALTAGITAILNALQRAP